MGLTVLSEGTSGCGSKIIWPSLQAPPWRWETCNSLCAKDWRDPSWRVLDHRQLSGPSGPDVLFCQKIYLLVVYLFIYLSHRYWLPCARQCEWTQLNSSQMPPRDREQARDWLPETALRKNVFTSTGPAWGHLCCVKSANRRQFKCLRRSEKGSLSHFLIVQPPGNYFPKAL